MNLTSASFDDHQAIPGHYALCVPDSQDHATFGANRNPALAWSGVPSGTRSLAVICVDPDAPSRPDDVNQEGRTVPADLSRGDFFHWVLVDLAPQEGGVAAGEHSDGVIPRGKPGPEGRNGTRHGLNDYTGWFAGDADLEGEYFGYDGPCPPWNDEIAHRYVFTVYALDVETCPVEGKFGGGDVLAAIEGHILEQASITATYSLNPAVSA